MRQVVSTRMRRVPYATWVTHDLLAELSAVAYRVAAGPARVVEHATGPTAALTGIADLVGRSLTELTAPADRERVLRALAAAGGGAYQVFYRLGERAVLDSGRASADGAEGV